MTMKSNTLIRFCAGATLVASTFGAQAATVTFNSWAYTNGNAVSVTSPTYNGPAGAFNVTVTNSEIPSVTGTFEALCVDLYEHINLPATYSNGEYTVVSGASYFSGDKAIKLAKLFTFVREGSLFNGTTSTLRDDFSTAMQLAVWNITYDADTTLASGTFSSASASATATNDVNGYYGANQLLSLSGALTSWTQSIYVLKSTDDSPFSSSGPGRQDQVIWTGGGTNIRVPEPASLSLAMLAFAAAGVATRRRKPVQG